MSDTYQNNRKEMNTKNLPRQITINLLECNRCNYQWYPKINKDGNIIIPKMCPNRKCHSLYWNRERKHKSKIINFGDVRDPEQTPTAKGYVDQLTAMINGK